MYCLCKRGKDSGFTAMHEKDASGKPIANTFNYDFWVCAECLRPTRMVFSKLTNNYAPLGASSIVSVYGRADGTNLLTWHTDHGKVQTLSFHSYPFMEVNGMDQGRNHLLTLWQKLDAEIDTIRSLSPEHPAVEVNKVRATTLAEVIQQLMHMFYADTNAVLAESMNRWEARQQGRQHESPGLAESYWDPTLRGAAATVERNKQTIAPKPLDPQKAAFVKHSLESGAMSPEELAKMFGVSIEVIKATVDA